MNYTLDSLRLNIEALQKKYPSKKISSEPFFTTNLNDLHTYDENILYYGILTHGPSSFNCEIYTNEVNTITIVENSQIEIMFSKIFTNLDGIATTRVRGQFRGHIIYLQD